MKRRLLIMTALLVAAGQGTGAPPPDWRQVESEAVRTLRAYVRLNTSNPPGDVTKAAGFLVDLLRREGIDVKRFESAPGRSIVLARLSDVFIVDDFHHAFAHARSSCRRNAQLACDLQILQQSVVNAVAMVKQSA